jgi:hypothetical protein
MWRSFAMMLFLAVNELSQLTRCLVQPGLPAERFLRRATSRFEPALVHLKRSYITIFDDSAS